MTGRCGGGFLGVITGVLVAVLPLLGSWLSDYDIRLYDQIHHRWQSDVGDIYFGAVNSLGSNEFALSLNLGLACFGDDSVQNAAKLATAALAVSMLTTQVLKCAVGRPRPDDPHCPRCKSSFPSGHTTAAFAMAYVYGSKYPRWRIPIYLGAISVGLARIYLGRHYPSDVLAGAAVGTLGGILIIKNERFVVEFKFF